MIVRVFNGTFSTNEVLQTRQEDMMSDNLHQV
jgi:hypothetical protein